jgi:hypothetical protein
LNPQNPCPANSRFPSRQRASGSDSFSLQLSGFRESTLPVVSLQTPTIPMVCASPSRGTSLPASPLCRGLPNLSVGEECVTELDLASRVGPAPKSEAPGRIPGGERWGEQLPPSRPKSRADTLGVRSEPALASSVRRSYPSKRRLLWNQPVLPGQSSASFRCRGRVQVTGSASL